MCIGKFDRTNLEKIASETGGKVYEVATLNELYSELGEKNHVSNVRDYDGDGFSDMEETYGLIVDSSGTRYKTKLDKDDSDDDGLKDNEEVIKTSWYQVQGKDHYGNTVWKRYYSMKSDPTSKDSDGDGAVDLEDATPTRYNDKLSYIFTEYNDKVNALIKESKLREFNNYIEKQRRKSDIVLYY